MKRLQLFKLRKERGLRVADVAQHLEISASFYYKIEQGHRNPTINLAKKIADFYGASVEALFFLDDSSSVQPTGTDGPNMPV